MAAADVGIF